LTVVLVIIGVFMVVELVAAMFSHSLVLLADAGHMLTDVGALSLALLAIWFAGKPATAEKTYGYHRSEILAGFINALILVAISFAILFGSYQRLKQPLTVAPIPVFLVAILGLAVNIISLKLLEEFKTDSINARAAYLEILSDCLISLGVMVSSIVIYFSHWYAADPIASGIIGVLILPRTWLLSSECTNILMEGTPTHIDLANLRKSLLAIEGVIDVHDVHVWTITSGLHSMSGHVRIDYKAEAKQILESVSRKLKDDFQLHHTTIQVEQEQAACEGERDACAS